MPKHYLAYAFKENQNKSTMIRPDIKEFLNSLPTNSTLVAATKYINSQEMRVLFDAGVTNFGENRVESFLEKHNQLSDLPIIWHFIGHLQRNKARKVINKINYLHSLDSLSLADLIDKERITPLDCFIEVSINLEESKNGVPYYKVKDFIKQCLQYKNIHIVGLMMMAIANSDDVSLHHQFVSLKKLKLEIEEELNISLPYLSMGMSDDYLIALREGATHIRLGRILLK